MAASEPNRANTLGTYNLNTGIGVGLRAVATIVDGILLGAIAIWSSPHHQRFGDRLAGTIVIRACKAA